MRTITVIAFLLIANCQKPLPPPAPVSPPATATAPAPIAEPIKPLPPVALHFNSQVMTPLYFDFDSDRLTADAKREIDRLVARGGEYSLTGHADERGTDAYNMDLGLRRCLSVKSRIEQLGLKVEECRSFGESAPTCTKHRETCWQKNRRVEVTSR